MENVISRRMTSWKWVREKETNDCTQIKDAQFLSGLLFFFFNFDHFFVISVLNVWTRVLYCIIHWKVLKYIPCDWLLWSKTQFKCNKPSFWLNVSVKPLWRSPISRLDVFRSLFDMWYEQCQSVKKSVVSLTIFLRIGKIGLLHAHFLFQVYSNHNSNL